MGKSKTVAEYAMSSVVGDIRRAKAILKNINWNFYQTGAFAPHEVYPFNCRKHHWYPATFVSEIPFTMVEILTLPNAVVYDPFGGIGTTYFQALLLNRKPLATEICRVAIEYMRSLFVLFNPEIDLNRIRSNIETTLRDFNEHEDYTSDVPKRVLVNRLLHWYSERTLNQLCFLFNRMAASRSGTIKAAMGISISAILKMVSSQNRGWGCIADNMLPKKEQIKDKGVFDMFRKHMNGLLDDISGHLNCVMQGYNRLYREISTQQTIFHEDVRVCESIPDNSVDLVITSPPYPNMTDYVTSQRLSYYFWGFDLIDKSSVKDVGMEIGARSRRSRTDSIDKYFTDMQQANEAISAKIKPGGFACYVMPMFSTDNENNKSRRRIVRRVLSSMDELDLIQEDEYERILPAKRRSHNIKWATLEREKIYLFRKV